MLGTIVNSLAIIGGCLIGLIVKGRLTEKISSTIMNGLALCVLYIGISGALKGKDTLQIIICIALGALIGEIIDIDRRLNDLGNMIERKINGKRKNNSNDKISISEGFVTSSLLFCVGAMAVVGSLESGLQGNNSTLFAKSILDGVSSIIFASSLGGGVMLSSIAIFIYQGSITLLAGGLSTILTDNVISNMSAVGSLLIVGLGFNMLGISKIKVANLLPGIFLPIIFGFFLK
ncbi:MULTISPECIES: DUF554 domain-containing protein [Clostridium]|jgi:hypothetical protein|uniref:DUF554 domain-containing protein n=3 Tax=Clostridium TaxID=1485 RepID=A0AAE2RUM3_CLOBE|nr:MULTISPECIES: DUF554 domain-containing protein [Clostridium]ABR33723.1 protein of unknown function DUF554 [Clostridium beijerinckii NCIMB 8052]AIU03323.1 hypothetical protein Cbs_1549 [Clostridium beijerinckii ATCC 35702]ALB47167.1 DUF554 domain-containing protein [Clostridium beijerinckii NRRL B-598]AVK50565.1 hypothetical protein AXY43_22540 [Clostridium sp. MF28]MBF7812145.1 DUF554 domain-containing protein [Clostridium beijerinckii]